MLSAAEISERTAFGDVRTFNRVFRKVTGETPTANRRRRSRDSSTARPARTSWCPRLLRGRLEGSAAPHDHANLLHDLGVASVANSGYRSGSSCERRRTPATSGSSRTEKAIDTSTYTSHTKVLRLVHIRDW